MKRSRGSRSKTRNKLKAVVKPGRSNPISRKIQQFKNEDFVHIIIDSSIHKGQPHPRFHGKTAQVTEKRGKAYILSLKDGNKLKKLIVRPEHLQIQK
jgi:large subunit ribosomal protein L21e